MRIWLVPDDFHLNPLGLYSIKLEIKNMKFIIFILLIAAGFFTYSNYKKNLNDPVKIKEKAQSSPYGCVDYYLNNAKIKNSEAMQSVCKENAVNSDKVVLSTISEAEKFAKSNFKDISSMNAGNSRQGEFDILAMLMAENGETLCKFVIRLKEDENKKWFIVYVSIG